MEANHLAADLGIGRTTLWRWTRADLIPAPTRIGRQALYSPAAVTAARSLVGAAR